MVVEARKATASSTLRATGLLLALGVPAIVAAILAAAHGGGTPQARAQMLAKLGPEIAKADWHALVLASTQVTAAASVFAFGLGAAWLVGREFADGTAPALFGLPVSRPAIAAAKLVVHLCWAVLVSLVLAVTLALVGLAFGLGVPGAGGRRRSRPDRRARHALRPHRARGHGRGDARPWHPARRRRRGRDHRRRTDLGVHGRDGVGPARCSGPVGHGSRRGVRRPLGARGGLRCGVRRPAPSPCGTGCSSCDDRLRSRSRDPLVGPGGCGDPRRGQVSPRLHVATAEAVDPRPDERAGEEGHVPPPGSTTSARAAGRARPRTAARRAATAAGRTRRRASRRTTSRRGRPQVRATARRGSQPNSATATPTNTMTAGQYASAASASDPACAASPIDDAVGRAEQAAAETQQHGRADGRDERAARSAHRGPRHRAGQLRLDDPAGLLGSQGRRPTATANTVTTSAIISTSRASRACDAGAARSVAGTARRRRRAGRSSPRRPSRTAGPQSTTVTVQPMIGPRWSRSAEPERRRVPGGRAGGPGTLGAAAPRRSPVAPRSGRPRQQHAGRARAAGRAATTGCAPHGCISWPQPMGDSPRQSRRRRGRRPCAARRSTPSTVGPERVGAARGRRDLPGDRADAERDQPDAGDRRRR